MTTWTLALAGLLLADPAGGGSADDVEQFIVVVEDAPIRDAASGNSLGPLMRGTELSRKKGEADYRTYEHLGKRIAIDATSILTKDEARKLFDESLRAKSRAADYADRALIYLIENRLADAVNDLNHALNLQPDLYRAYLRRSQCRQRQSLVAQGKARDRLVQLSLEDAEKCVELKPDELLSYDARFRASYSIDVARATADAEKSLELRPDHTAVLNNWAKLLVDGGRFDEAMTKLNRAIELDPEYSDAYTNRGLIHHHARRFDEAIADATQAIRFNRLNASAWNNRGNAYRETKQFPKAIDDFSELIRVEPNRSDGYFGRANVYFSRGNEMDEEDYVRKGIAVPNGPRRSTDSFHLALTDCEAALKINPLDFKCFNTKGNVLKKLGKPREAIEVFDLAMETIRKESLAAGYTLLDEQKRAHPIWDAVEAAMAFSDPKTIFNAEIHKIALAHPHRATIAAIFGNRADAWRMVMLDPEKPDFSARPKMLADLTRAIVFDPNNPEYFRVRGYYNLEFERWEQAVSDLSRAIMLRPNYTEAVRGRIIGLMKLFRFNEAWQDAKSLRDMGTPLDGPLHDELKRKSGQNDYPP